MTAGWDPVDSFGLLADDYHISFPGYFVNQPVLVLRAPDAPAVPSCGTSTDTCSSGSGSGSSGTANTDTAATDASSAVPTPSSATDDATAKWRSDTAAFLNSRGGENVMLSVFRAASDVLPRQSSAGLGADDWLLFPGDTLPSRLAMRAAPHSQCSVANSAAPAHVSDVIAVLNDDATALTVAAKVTYASRYGETRRSSRCMLCPSCCSGRGGGP